MKNSSEFSRGDFNQFILPRLSYMQLKRHQVRNETTHLSYWGSFYTTQLGLAFTLIRHENEGRFSIITLQIGRRNLKTSCERKGFWKQSLAKTMT